MFPVRTIHPQQLSLDFISAYLRLTALVWPPEADHEMSNASEVLFWQQQQKSTSFVLELDGDLVAHARIFPREMKAPNTSLQVACLAAVCVHPDFRGRGFGVDVAQAALDFAAQMNVDVALWQTGVPQFYENLGAKLVDNEFIHSAANNNAPFWEPWTMIYPANFDWPAGRIDINGEGF